MPSVDGGFIGRDRELAAFDMLLAAASPTRVLAFWGPSGFGKSTLLRRCVARADGWHTQLLDLETLSPWDSSAGDFSASADDLLFRLARMLALGADAGRVGAARNARRLREFEEKAAVAAR